MLIGLDATLRRVPRWAVLAGCLGYTALVAWGDYRIGFAAQLGVLYLPAIAAAAWSLGSAAGVGFAVLSTAVAALLDWYPAAARIEPSVLLWNSAARFAVFLFAAMLVSITARQTVRLRNLAREDPLTGIPNRRAFFGALDRTMEWSRRRETPWVLAYLDVDDFKRINDGKGHGEGDKVLQVVATSLRQGIRRIDVAARLGGDEFAVLLPETDAQQAEIVIGNLLALLREWMTRDGRRVTLSVGVVTFTVSPTSPDTAMALADACMYGVKEAGKDGVAYRTWP